MDWDLEDDLKMEHYFSSKSSESCMRTILGKDPKSEPILMFVYNRVASSPNDV